jgi:hypothetical protein
MNRREAAAKVDRLLDAAYAAVSEGRCAVCGAILEVVTIDASELGDRKGVVGSSCQPGDTILMFVGHSPDCSVEPELNYAVAEAIRWNFRLEEGREERLHEGRPAYVVRLMRTSD